MEPARRFCPSPARIPASTWCSRCCTAPSARTARCRACWSWRTCRTSGAGVLASAVSMDKEVMKRVCARARPARGRVRHVFARAIARTGCAARSIFRCSSSPRISGSSVGISKASNREELEAALALAAELRPQDHCRARHRRPRVRVLGAGQREARGRRALRDPAFARVSTTTKTSTCSNQAAHRAAGR